MIARVIAERDELESACRNTVLKTMRQLGLQSKVAKSFKPTTTRSDPSKRPAMNLLDQDFDIDKPNRKWVADITYLPTRGGWVYLAVVTPGGGPVRSQGRGLVDRRFVGHGPGE